MDQIIALFTNYVLMSAVFGWIVAQILKFFTGIFKVKEFSFVELFFGTGGMPSSHTAAVVGLTTACAMKFGLGSYQVAISGVLAMIVMRDAMGMRRQVGEHAKALNSIFKELADAHNDPTLTQKALAELVGHTPLQVFAGMFVGIAVGIGLYYIPVFV